jgi:hypothetical protein
VILDDRSLDLFGSEWDAHAVTHAEGAGIPPDPGIDYGGGSPLMHTLDFVQSARRIGAPLSESKRGRGYVTDAQQSTQKGSRG